MGKVNREWHLAHVLGQHAPLDERVRWHLEHAKECACREIPPTVAAEIQRRAEAEGESGG